MDSYQILQTVLDNLGVPVFGAIGAAMAFVISKWGNKIGDSVIIKNEIESIEKRTKARKEILDALKPSVEAAVASNMQLVNAMKKKNGKLSEDDITTLNASAKELIYNTLPESLTSDNGELLKIIGGRKQLDAAIEVMIEQYVYEYKLKSVNTSSVDDTETSKVESESKKTRFFSTSQIGRNIYKG